MKRLRIFHEIFRYFHIPNTKHSVHVDSTLGRCSIFHRCCQLPSWLMVFRNQGADQNLPLSSETPSIVRILNVPNRVFLLLRNWLYTQDIVCTSGKRKETQLWKEIDRNGFSPTSRSSSFSETSTLSTKSSPNSSLMNALQLARVRFLPAYWKRKFLLSYVPPKILGNKLL